MSAIFLPIILILGALLRFYNNTAIALWHDEAFSALYMRYDWGEMMHRITLDVHPPLYYLVLRLWTYFAGTSLLSLRLLSILFGVLTIWAAYLFVKAAFSAKGGTTSGGQKLALLSALLVALNPFQIQYALEARMYTLGTFLILWSSYFLVKALDTKSQQNKKYWLCYALTGAASLYTHYYLIFSVAAQVLFIIYAFLRSHKISILVKAAFSYLLVLILYLPWLRIFWEQTRRVQQNFWIPPIDYWSIPGTVWKMAFGGGGINRMAMVAATAVAVLLIIYFLKKISSYHRWQVLLGVLVPFLGAIFLSFFTNIYLDRYFVFASTFFTILIAVSLYRVPKFIFRWFLIILLVVSTGFAFFKNWADLDIKNKPGMAQAAEFINENANQKDQIYVGSTFVFFTFKYYNQTPIKPLLFSTGPLETIPHFSGTALLTNQDLIHDFSKTPKGSMVFILWTTGFGGSKPQVPKNWKQISERSSEDTPNFKGRIIVTEYKVN